MPFTLYRGSAFLCALASRCALSTSSRVSMLLAAANLKGPSISVLIPYPLVAAVLFLMDLTIDQLSNILKSRRQQSIKRLRLNYPSDQMRLAHFNAHPRDRRVTFHEVNHEYFLDGAGKFPISVSGVWSRYFSEFNGKDILDNYFERWAANPSSKYHSQIHVGRLAGKNDGSIKREITTQWLAVGTEARIKGTYLHRQIELFLNAEDCDDSSMEMKQFMNFLSEIAVPKGWVPYRTEWAIFDDVNMVAGQVDCIFRDPQDNLHMVDWKRVRTDIHAIEGMEYERYGWGPCQNMLDNKFYHYTIQQNLYASILQNHYDLAVESICLVQLHSERDHYQIIPLPMLRPMACNLLVLAGMRTYLKNQSEGDDGKANPREKTLPNESPSAAAMDGLPGGQCKVMKSDDGAIHIGLQQYMRKGCLYMSTFGDGCLWVAQMTATCSPNPLAHIERLIEQYGESRAGSEDPPPCSVDEIACRFSAQMQLVSKTTTDPDHVGWAMGRIGFYMDEAMVKEFLMYFDDLMAYRRNLVDVFFEKLDSPIKIVIHMLDSALLTLKFDKIEDELQCEFVALEEAHAHMSVFDLPPPIVPPRLVTVSLEMVTATKLNVIFGGNTQPFLTNFEQQHVRLCKMKDLNGIEYHRHVVKYVDISASHRCADSLEGWLDDCMNGAPVVMRIMETAFDSTAIKAIIASLQTAARHLRVEFREDGDRLDFVDESVHIGLQPYMRKGSLYSRNFGDGRIWVAQMFTARLPSPLVELSKLIEQHGNSQAESKHPTPRSLDEVACRYAAEFQSASKTMADPDRVHWTKGRVGFYIDEARLLDFFVYFSTLMTFQQNWAVAHKMEDANEIVIHLLGPAPLKFIFDKFDDASRCKIVVVEEAVAYMSVFDLPPPIVPPRVVVMSLEMIAESELNVVCGGNVGPFHAGFAHRNIKLCNVVNAWGIESFVRIMAHLDISGSQNCMDLIGDLLDNCLQGAPVVVRIKETAFDSKAAEAIIRSLQTGARHMRIEF